jgi:uncharacterized protein
MPLLNDDTAIATLLRASRSIAVVGASDKPYRDSYAITRYLLSAGYTVYPINPTVPAVLGLRTYPDLKSIGAPVDIVDVFRRPELVPPIVEEAISTGAKSIWFQFGVTNPEASLRASQMGLNVVEDRCIMVEHRRLDIAGHRE